MLAVEYSIVLFAGGVEMRAAWSVVKIILERALKAILEGKDHEVLRSLDIVNDVSMIGVSDTAPPYL